MKGDGLAGLGEQSPRKPSEGLPIALESERRTGSPRARPTYAVVAVASFARAILLNSIGYKMAVYGLFYVTKLVV